MARFNPLFVLTIITLTLASHRGRGGSRQVESRESKDAMFKPRAQIKVKKAALKGTDSYLGYVSPIEREAMKLDEFRKDGNMKLTRRRVKALKEEAMPVGQVAVEPTQTPFQPLAVASEETNTVDSIWDWEDQYPFLRQVRPDTFDTEYFTADNFGPLFPGVEEFEFGLLPRLQFTEYDASDIFYNLG